MDDHPGKPGIDRRGFLTSMGAGALGAAALGTASEDAYKVSLLHGLVEERLAALEEAH